MEKVRFKVKDFVVYPLHGVGTIETTFEKEVKGEKTKFYKVKMRESGMFISVPVANAVEMGLRHIIKKSEIASILKKFSTLPKDIEDNWKLRYQENIDKLKTGDIGQVATVVKELFLRNKVKNLSIMERKQYENAYKMLVKEISLAGNTDEQEVSNLISDKLDNLAQKLD